MYNRNKIYFHTFLTGMRTGRKATLEQLKSLLCADIPINRQELERKDCLNKLRKKEITAEECIVRLKSALQYTVPPESIKTAKDGPDIYLTCAELGCVYNIVMKSRNDAEEFNLS